MGDDVRIEYSVLSTPDGYVTIARINRQGFPWVMLTDPEENERGPWALADQLTHEGER